MKTKTVMDTIKSRLLELWIEINHNTVKDSAFIKYVEGAFKEFFQFEYINYYYVKKDKLIRLLDDKNDEEYHALPFDNNENFYKENQVSNQLLALQKEHSPQVNSSFIIRYENDIGGVLFFKNSHLWERFLNSSYVEEMRTLFFETALISKKQMEKQRENQLNETLLHMSKVFHSTMDANKIIDEMVNELQTNFPKRYFNLVLSNDQEREPSSMVHLFDYENETTAAVEAFVSGEITTEYISKIDKEIMNIPILGLQGTYGVIQLELFPQKPLDSSSLRKIHFLSDSAGKALENAKLYAQSHRIVADLQLINESSHRLNMNLSKSEIFSYLSTLMIESFKPSEVAIVFINEGVELKEGTNAYFKEQKGQTYLKFVVEHFEKKQEPLFVADLQTHIIEEKLEYRALMAIPIVVNEKIVGFTLVVHKEAYYFSFESYKLMQSIIRHSSLAISNALLREEMQIVVDQDYLTKLYTRSYLERFVGKAFQTDSSGVLILVDIDDFKKVNDKHGHQVGDKVLETVADVMRANTKNLGICARWGGEELAAYFPNENVQEINPIIEKIMKDITCETTPSITVSIGLSFWSVQQMKGYTEIFKQADEALYSAKANGKNQAIIFEEDIV